jgi:hypothetical protein
MLFFDLWEPTILWRGRLDVASSRIVEGEVTTNKKRFGLFPYTETLATFEAELLAPGQKLPTVVLPNFSDLRFTVSDHSESYFYFMLPKCHQFVSIFFLGRLPGIGHNLQLLHGISFVIFLS